MTHSLLALSSMLAFALKEQQGFTETQFTKPEDQPDTITAVVTKNTSIKKLRADQKGLNVCMAKTDVP